MPDKDKNREPSEHYIPVELTRSAKASEKAVETMRGTSGAVRKTAEAIERRKRANRRALDSSKSR